MESDSDVCVGMMNQRGDKFGGSVFGTNTDVSFFGWLGCSIGEV